MGQHPYPHFLAAIEQLGKTDDERARVLGVSRRMIVSYRKGAALPSVLIVKRHPTIDRALTLDLSPKTEHKSAQAAT